MEGRELRQFAPLHCGCSPAFGGAELDWPCGFPLQVGLPGPS